MAKRPLSTANERSKQETNRRKIEFIDCLRGDKRVGRLPLSIRAACDHVGIVRHTFYAWRDTDEAFRNAVELALDDGLDVLEDEAVRRGVEGVQEPVYQGGELVGHKQVYSDKMLEMVLAGRRSAVYGRQAQLNVQNNVVVTEPTDRDVAKALALLIAETKAKQEEDVSSG